MTKLFQPLIGCLVVILAMAENNGCAGLSDVIQILRILLNHMIKYALSPQTHFYPILT